MTPDVARRFRLGSFFLAPLAVAFVLEKVDSSDAAVAAGYRAMLAVLVLSTLATIGGTIVARHAGRGPTLALAAAIVAALGLSPVPVVIALGLAAVVVVDARRANGATLVPWTRFVDGVFVIGAVTLAIVAGSVALRPTPDLTPVTAQAATTARPDIYLLMLDGMGRADVLADAYGHDAGRFVDALEEHGFEVATRSHANYPVTALSLASLVNGQHLVDLGFRLGDDPAPGPLARAIDHNRLFPALSRAGYETLAVSSGYEQVALRSADRFIDTGELNELELAILGATLVAPLVDGGATALRESSFRSRATSIVGEVGRLAGERHDRPRLVFVHFPLPHAPFVVDETCGPVAGGDPYYLVDASGIPYKTPAMIEAEIDRTVAQTSCTERLAIEMIDGIVAGARPDAVIVAFSDHGPDTTLNWYAPEADAIEQRLANLFAARTPGHPGLFPDDASLVNILPTLLRTYVGLDVADQGDEAYFVMPDSGLVEVDLAGTTGE
jgi:hypothetical protein